MTQLSDALSKSAASKSPATRLQAALAGKRPFRPVRIPGLDLDAVMTVLGTERHLDIAGEAAAVMQRRGIAQNVLNQGNFELEEALHALSTAVVHSEQDPTPIGTLADWGKLSPEVIAELWVRYAELRAEHDPLIEDLTQDEINGIRAEITKKNAHALRYYGASRLARYLLTSADQPASSSTPKSEHGATSPGT